MRLKDDAIPTTFQRLDEETVAANRFVNVRNQQVMRENHNALCAGGHMRTIFADDYGWYDSGSWGAPQIHTPEIWGGSDHPAMMNFLYDHLIYVSPFVKELKCQVLGQDRSDFDISLYGALVPPWESGQAKTYSSVSMTSTIGDAVGLYSLTLPMPPLSINDHGRQAVRFQLWWTPDDIGAADILGAHVNVAAVDTDNYRWVEIATASLGTVAQSDIIYFPSDSTIEPRIVQGLSTSGSNTRLHVHKTHPWEASLPTTSDTCNFRLGEQLYLHRVYLWELHRSGNFSDLEIRL